jgi:hypothetical protein
LLRVDASLFLDSESFIQVIESFARVIASFMDLGVSLLLVGVPFVRGGVTFAGAASRVRPGDASSRPGGAPFHRSDGASRTTNGPSSTLDERFPYAARRSGSSTATDGFRAPSRAGGNGTCACGEGGGARLAAIAGPDASSKSRKIMTVIPSVARRFCEAKSLAARQCGGGLRDEGAEGARRLVVDRI